MNWEPLASKDPIPGCPDTVENLAKDLQDMADRLEKQEAQLLGFIDSASSWAGEAQKSFVRMAEKVPPKLHKAHQRYVIASGALRVYGGKLKEAQGDAESLRVQAENLQDQITTLECKASQERQDKAEWEKLTNPLGPFRDSNYDGQLCDALDKLGVLKETLAGVKEQLATDGRIAATKIKSAAEILTDDGSWKRTRRLWHRTKKAARWVVNTRAFKVISTVVKVIAAVLAIAALILLLVVPGANIAAAAALAALVAGVAALAISATEAHGGTGSWRMVAVDAVLTVFGLRALKSVGAAGKSVAKSVTALKGVSDSAAENAGKLRKLAEFFARPPLKFPTRWRKVPIEKPGPGFGLETFNRVNIKAYEALSKIADGTAWAVSKAAAGTDGVVEFLTKSRSLRLIDAPMQRFDWLFKSIDAIDTSLPKMPMTCHFNWGNAGVSDFAGFGLGLNTIYQTASKP